MFEGCAFGYIFVVVVVDASLLGPLSLLLVVVCVYFAVNCAVNVCPQQDVLPICVPASGEK